MKMDYDILAVGGGIAGMEAAQTLGDMGYRVLLVEKEATIGGKMILLSKVFPTLDCASCIATPKMATTAHHANVTTLVYSEVEEIGKNGGGTFKVRINKNPTYVDPNLCTGCQQCEFACTVAVPDQFNFDLVARRAAYIPFPQAVPKKAVIEREGSSPCSLACPAGIKAHGYVSLVRSGKFEEAYKLVLEDTPLVGALGRACFAPCEGQCTRGALEGALPIRRLKRFIADYYYERHPEPEYGSPTELLGKRVAIVGSGPAGLTAAYHLALKGYRVKIFEAESEPGGLLRFGIPTYRLPKDIVDRDVKNVTALGVEIETGIRISSLKKLREQGFDAVFLATGSLEPVKLGIPGEDLEGVVECHEFLKEINGGRRRDLTGKTVLLIGGGNACIDPARVALRLNAQKVIVQYRRSRAEMPAFAAEVVAAEEEGVELSFLTVPTQFIGNNGQVKEAVCQRMRLGDPDESGRRRPMPIEGSEFTMPIDMAIVAIGNAPTTSPFRGELELNRNGGVTVDPDTLQTSLPYVFAGGDVVIGPSTIVEASGQGKRAAFYIDRYLSGEALLGVEFDYRLPPVKQEAVLQRQETYRTLTPIGIKERPPRDRIQDFEAIELPMTADEVTYSAGRCLDCGICSECHQCIHACPANAINLGMKGETLDLEVGSVIVSTGFRLFPAEQKFHYGYGRFKNVITAMQMDRLLSPTRPYNKVLRPSDGKVPDNIAYVLCTGSRDQTVGNPICSRICCMYSIKQAQLAMGALPLADITIYYIDIRAFGKGYQEFYEQARAMGTYFVKGKISRIEEAPGGNLALCYEDIDNGGHIKQTEHDLVVLSVGLLPNVDALRLFHGDGLEADEYLYVKEVDGDLSPGKTSIDGMFVAGGAAAAMDIPDAILHAGATAAQAAAYVERVKGQRS
jgi:heterodisulfide reductase subunit A-like polyferredoxin